MMTGFSRRQALLAWTLDAYVPADQELGTCSVLSVLCMEEMCGVLEVEVVWRRGKVMTIKPCFTEAVHAFESMRAFMYAHDITKRDKANTINIERLLLCLK
jgi:hypothetical protein